MDLFVWGREAWETWTGAYPARQTLEASQAIARRHGAHRPVFARQAKAAIAGGVFHNDVVCVGAKTCLLFHERAFEDKAAMMDGVRRAAEGLFEPEFIEVSAADLPLPKTRVKSYLFNSPTPGAAQLEARLTLLSPTETRNNPRARLAAEAIARLQRRDPAVSITSTCARACATAAAPPACACAWC